MCISRGNTKSSFSYSPTQTSFEAPELNLTMEGGNSFFVTKPVEVFSVKVQLFTGFHHIYIYIAQQSFVFIVFSGVCF